MKDVLHEAMDIDGLKSLLDGIRTGAIRTIAVDTPVPSQFAHEILNSSPFAFLDDAPLEERRARAVQLRRTIPASVLEEVGALDPNAIEQVRSEVRPDIRDADELHDLLQTLIVLPVPAAIAGWELLDRAWEPHFVRLLHERRAVVAQANGQRYWVASERAREFVRLFEDATFDPQPPVMARDEEEHRDKSMDRALLGWLQHTGPMTSEEFSLALGLPLNEIEHAMLRLEVTGAVLRGSFRAGATGTAPQMNEWCDRRLLARIHRLTIGLLRKQIEPVTPAQFMNWLLRWQHVAEGTQLAGERGLQEALQQLQGFEIPANAWERQILARRVRDYDPAALDELCLNGTFGWGRLSPHPATLEAAPEGDAVRRRRVVPTSVAPVTFFLREDCAWMQPRRHGEDAEQENGLSAIAREVLDWLRRRGASFFADLVRGTGKLKSEIETGLWELVAAGFVTADGFDNLRALIDPKRRAGQGHGRASRPRHAAGRWSLLFTGDDATTDKATQDRNARTAIIESACWMLLRRYGIVFRELLARETSAPAWREMQVLLRRLEDRGEIRGGRFVAGFVGEQFALPVAVESVREMRRQEPNNETVTISAADPLNLVGIIVSGNETGERVPSISGRTVTFRDGVYVAEGIRKVELENDSGDTLTA